MTEGRVPLIDESDLDVGDDDDGLLAESDDDTPIEHDEPLPDEVRDGNIELTEGDEP